MSVQPKTHRREPIEAGFRHSAADLDGIRLRLRRAVERRPSDEAFQRLIELAARCVSEAAAWDAYADAQDVSGIASWTELQRLEREAHAAKQARIQLVDRLRAELEE